MKVDGSLKSLLQGVSQQPPRDRLPGQATAQVNMSSDPITGLTRRPGSDLVDFLLTSSAVKGWHDFDVVDGNRYIASFYSNTVKVFDLNGVEQTVNVDSNAQAYLNSASAGDMRFITVENETLVVNRGAKVALTSAERTYYNNSGRQVFIVQVLGGQYGRKYTIKVDGTEYASYQVPDGDTATDVQKTATKVIATELYNDLVANLTGWTITRRDDIIVMARSTSTEYTLTVNDDYGNTNIKGNGTIVSRTEDLPRYAPHNFVCRIAENTDPETDLWFRFIVEGNEDDWSTTNSMSLFGQQGYWQETVAPDTKTTFNDATMPHKLTYDPVADEFTFSRGTWEDRRVGTDTSNPQPTFVGATVNDVFTFQGRVGFLSGPNVIMSRTTNNYDFWFGSVSAQADSDPIDVRSKVEASTMQAAVQHNKDLVIFSNKGQFVMPGRTSLTPANAALVLSSSFEAELSARPVGAGRNVFFATNFGSYTGIREFFVEGSTDVNDSRAITQHVKKYLLGTVSQLSASSSYDTLFVRTDASAKTIYWYQYIWNNEEKVQSSWSTMTLPEDVVYTFFEEETVYIIIREGNDHYLLRMSMDVQDSLNVGYHIHGDCRFDVFGVSTQFYLPFDFLEAHPLVAVQSTDCPTPGLTVPIDSIEWDAVQGAYKVTLSADMFGGDIIVSSMFRSSYTPTMPIIKDQDGIKVGTGRFIVGKFNVSLKDTGYINGTILSKYGNGATVSFNGRFVGDPDNIVGQQPLSSSQFVMPFGRNVEGSEIEFWTDTHLPLTILDIEWEGQYNKRGKRVQGSASGG